MDLLEDEAGQLNSRLPETTMRQEIYQRRTNFKRKDVISRRYGLTY